MRLPAVALALLVLPAAAGAQQKTLDKIEITGLKSIPQEKLLAVTHKPGSKVTIPDDLIADQEAISKVLEAEHVVGNIQTGMRDKKNGHVDAIFQITDNGIQAPEVKTVTREVTPKLDHFEFQGNSLVPSDVLVEAAGVPAGTELNKDNLGAALGRVSEAYKKYLAKHGRSAKLAFATGQGAANGDKVVVIIKVTETDVKRSSKDSSGYGGSPE